MAKQIKWIEVDADTQESVAITPSKSGSTNPNLTDLVQQFDWGQYRYGTCADSVTINTASNDNFIFEISDADYIADIKGKIEEYVREWKVTVYEEEKNLEEAYQLSAYLTDLYPNNSYFKTYYGRILYRLGKYDDAKVIFESILNSVIAEQQGYEYNTARYATYFLGSIWKSYGNLILRLFWKLLVMCPVITKVI